MNFWVPGEARTKGSWRPVRNRRTGKTLLLPSNKREPGWASQVRLAAKNAAQGKPCIPGGCVVSIGFFLPRPKRTKLDSPRPDLDKLVRSCLDAMTGVIYADDSQVVRVTASKRWADAEGPGARVIVICWRGVLQEQQCNCCDCAAERAGV